MTKKYGARSLRRAIQKEIADPLSVEILSKKFEKNSLVNVVVEEDR
jgi:ATP-dependent Clp protease ATP-binding subunit ClpA